MTKGGNHGHQTVLPGQLFFGAVEFTVTGAPDAMGYCHCTSCRQWSAGPVNAFTLWKPDAIQVTRDADNIDTYNKTPQSYHKWYKTFGGHLFTEHPCLGLTDVYAAVIPELAYTPGVHINYQDAVLHIRDGLPKLKNVPKEFGGSGINMTE